jgi:hypothetical protein
MHTLAGAFHFAAYLAHYDHNAGDVERLASNLIELSTRENFALWLAAGAMLRGWARAAKPQLDQRMMPMLDPSQDSRQILQCGPNARI